MRARTEKPSSQRSLRYRKDRRVILQDLTTESRFLLAPRPLRELGVLCDLRILFFEKIGDGANRKAFIAKIAN
jgi:hypothetical protein